jgi:diguanylate cyclase (GGDEF)-like protein
VRAPDWTPDGIAPLTARLGDDLCFRAVGRSLARLLDRSEDALLGTSMLEVAAPDDLAQLLEAFAVLRAGATEIEFDCGLTGASGQALVTHWAARLDGDGIALVGRDATTERELRSQLADAQHRLSLASALASCGSWDWDLVSDRFTLDAHAAALLGIRWSDLTGTLTDLTDRLTEVDRVAVAERGRWMLNGGDVDVNLLLYLDGGTPVEVAMRGRTTQRDGRGRPRRASGILSTERHHPAVGRRLLDLATTDELTGLGNRRSFDLALRSEWHRSRDSGSDLAVVLVDVDGLKRVNDRSGHVAGDAALVDVARRLQRCLRVGQDLLARWGGDEFVALLPGVGPGRASVVAERMVRSVRDQEVTVSAGVATNGPRIVTSDELLQQADGALYTAKRAGKDRVATGTVGAAEDRAS